LHGTRLLQQIHWEELDSSQERQVAPEKYQSPIIQRLHLVATN